MITICLLGNFALLAPEPIRLSFRRSKGLLAYLAVEKTVFTRAKLCDLLWSDKEQGQSRSNLRQCLMDIRRVSPVQELVTSDREFLQLNTNLTIRTDYDLALGELSSNSPDLRYISNWRGHVLSDLDDIDPQFDEWLYFCRNEISSSITASLEKIITNGSVNRTTAFEAARLLYQVDPANETAVKRIITMDAMSGKLSSALRTYNHYDRYLRRTFDVGPSPDIRELRRSIIESSQRPVSEKGDDAFELRLLGSQHQEDPIEPFMAAKSNTPRGDASLRSRYEALAGAELTPFVGRLPELQTLKEAYSAMIAGQGSFVRVVGEQGIGKSRLVLEFMKSIETDEQLLVLTSGVPGVGFIQAYGYVRKFFEDLVDRLPRGGLRGSAINIPALHRVLRRLEIKAWTDQFALDPRLTEEEELTYDLGDLICDTLDGLSDHFSVVMVADDYYLSDQDSFHILYSILPILPFSRILILGTAASDTELVDRLAESTTEIKLHRLNQIESARIIKHFVQGYDLNSNVLGNVIKTISGHPLLLEEALRAGVEKDSPLTDIGSYLDEDVAHRTVNRRVQTVVHERLSRLSPVARRVLCLVSCFAGPVPLNSLRELLEDLDDSFGNLINKLASSGFVIMEHRGGVDVLQFSHSLVRAGVYSSISREEKLKLHKAIFDFMNDSTGLISETEVAERAHHAFASGNLQQAFDDLFAAAKYSASRAAHHFAIEQVQGAIATFETLGLQVNDDRRAECYLLMGESSIALGRLRVAKDTFSRADFANLGGKERHLYVRGLVAQAGLESITGGLCVSLSLVETAKCLSSSTGRRDNLIECEVQSGICDFVQGRFLGAISTLEKLTNYARTEAKNLTLYEGVSVAVDCFGYLGMSLAQVGRFDEARAAVFQASSSGRETGRSIDVAFAEFYRQYVLSHQGSTFMSISLIKAAIFHCDANKLVFARPWLQGQLGLVYELKGEIQRGVELHEQSLAAAREMGIRLYEAYDMTALARLYLKAGQLRSARAYAEKAIEISEREGYRSVLVWALRNMGLIVLETERDHEVANTFLNSAIAVAKELSMLPDLAHLYVHKGRVALRGGERLVGLDYVETADSMYMDLKMTHWAGDARLLRADLNRLAEVVPIESRLG